MKRKIILLTKSSDFQNYLANKLFQNNIIDTVILEEGSSIKLSEKITISKIIKNITIFLNFKNLFYKIYQILMFDKFYGNKKSLNNKIFGQEKVYLNKGIFLKKTKSINSSEIINFIISKKYKNIIVFGTSILNMKKFKKINDNFINLHWGYSPNYRGEGIVSALSKADYQKLGVTIHKISNVIDQGNIIFRKKVKINSKDNFYSIGLKMTKIATKQLLEKKLYKNLSIIRSKSSNKGFLYDSKFMKKNYKMFYMAYKNIRLLK